MWLCVVQFLNVLPYCSELAFAWRSVFEYALECLQLDQAMVAVVQLYKLERLFEVPSPMNSTQPLTVSAIESRVWRSCLLSLVMCACNVGQLSWLCSSATNSSAYINADTLDLDSEIVKILEYLGASVNVVNRQLGKQVGASQRYTSSHSLSGLCYYECLTVYLISKQTYKHAANTMFAFMKRIDAVCAENGSNMLLLQLW
jgi:hypothetical protein